MLLRVLLISVITLSILTGCGSGNTRKPSAVIAPVDAQAVTLFDSGEYEQAAVEYLRLAKGNSEYATSYQLSAADAYIHQHKFEQAEAIINAIDTSGNDVLLLATRNILLARIALSRHQTARTETLLNLDIPANANMKLLANWHAIRAELYESQNLAVNAAIERIQLGNYLQKTAESQENTNRIWTLLNSVDLSELTRLKGAKVDNLQPWIELTAINKAHIPKKSDLEKAVSSWSAAYPNHPAIQLITSKILAAGDSFQILPEQIALLLPLTGQYENYAEKIRDGFLSAWLTESSFKPSIRIYNTTSGNILEIYQKAVDEGADFIVGPLEKEAVKALSELKPVPVRTLALNQIELTDSRASTIHQIQLPNLVQFGLPPEDEAYEVARRGILEGHTRALIISTADDFGNRVVNAFSSEWTRLGGRALERISIDPRTDDFMLPIKQLLNIDSSEARIATLRQTLGRSITATSRVRNDSDFIFMVASNLTARQIVPHLQFFRATNIPVYTISTVYAGNPDPQVDSDLNGVEFVDMPWLLNNASDIHLQLTQGWQAESINLPRYYAFGIDAFRLISRIGQLVLDQNSRYSGETGNLYLTNGGIIHRTLAWARFVDGQPQALVVGESP